MKISYNWLKDYFSKLPQPEKLADLLTEHSFETEFRGNDLLDVDVLPNRGGDCFSVLGIARELAALTGAKLKIPSVSFTEVKEKTVDFLKVEVKSLQDCPRYNARVIKGVKIGPSPEWLKNRLIVCGLQPINNVVDISNYVMLETGQPLHAFDADKVEGKLIVRRAKKNEKIKTLDGKEYDLTENILVIADERKVLCLAGIKGGEGPGISAETKNIILEGANFSSHLIRNGSRQLELKTDASWRFEHGVDPNLTAEALNRLADLIQKIAGGKILKGSFDFYPRKNKPLKIRLNPEKVDRLLGVKIPQAKIKNILEKLDFKVSSKNNYFEIISPTRRLDVSLEEDLIEEIARFYGLENIKSQLPAATLIPAKRNDNLVYQHKAKDILSNLGFNEVYNYSFVSEKRVEDSRLPIENLAEVANPVSQEQKYLRPNLIINLLKNIEENKKYKEEIRIFEIGKVFQENKNSKDKITEREKLGIILSLGKKSSDPEEFYILKGITDSLLEKFNLSEYFYDDKIEEKYPIMNLFHSNRLAEIKIGNELIGQIGEIAPDLLKKIGIDLKLAALEIDFEKLIKLASEEKIYLPPSKYPSAVRDIALLVENGTKVVEVLNLINSAGGSLISDIDLFDIYEGEKIPQGKKSLAFHIIFQSNKQTLTDKEINQLQEKIIKVLEEEGGWEVRKQNGF